MNPETVSAPLILIAAGGTGGHMFPARAFADSLVARGARVALVTDPRGRRYTEGFPAEAVCILPVANADSGGLAGRVAAAGTVLKSIGQVRPFLKAQAPAAIVGFGGYPTFPVLASAGRTPVLIHEQNAVLGRVNRLFQNGAAAVASGFARLDRLEPKARHVFVGNPVREAIVEARQTPYPDPADGPLRLLVTGGSQGARILGDIVPHALAALPETLRYRLFVSHQVREEQCEAARAVYKAAVIEAEVWPFFKDMAGRLARAHLVIGRAGASTVSETAVVGRPALLVPLPSATNDHQTFNAMALADAGAAVLMAERDLSVESLVRHLETLLTDAEALRAMAAKARAAGQPDAAEALADLTLGIVAGGGADQLDPA